MLVVCAPVATGSRSPGPSGQSRCVLSLVSVAVQSRWQGLPQVMKMDSGISYNKAGFWSLVLGSSGQVRLRLESSFFAAVPSWRGPEAAMKRFSSGSMDKVCSGGQSSGADGALQDSFSRRGGVGRKKQGGLWRFDDELLRSWGTAKFRSTLSAAVVCQPTQMASRWLALTPASITGVLTTSMERPSTEFAAALLVESGTSGLVPVSGAGGCSQSSTFIGGDRGGLDGVLQSSCRVFCANVWDCFAISSFLEVPFVNCSCTALI